MHFKSFTLLSVLAGLLLLTGCQDTSIKHNIIDGWWPIHAAGSFDNGHFTANWDGDLNTRGGINITFVSKTDPSMTYDDMLYFKALRFEKDRKTFQYLSIQKLEYEASRSLKYYIKDRKIYFEIMNEAGRGTGEYEEGKDIKFLNDDRVLIDGVTYERYAAYRRRVVAGGEDKLPIAPDGSIPVFIYK